MSQNPSTSKFSSFIGIILLFVVIGFTVFINFFSEKPNEEIVEETEVVTETPEFEFLEDTDFAALWKLENINTDSTNFSYDGQRTYIHISKTLGSATNNPSENIYFDKLDATTKKHFEQAYKNFAQGEFIANYGILDFKNSYPINNSIRFEDVEIRQLNAVDSSTLMEIGSLFMKYQIESITTKSIYGDFTLINLKDGRRIFLIKQDREIKDNEYKELLEKSDHLNDSTRIVY